MLNATLFLCMSDFLKVLISTKIGFLIDDEAVKLSAIHTI